MSIVNKHPDKMSPLGISLVANDGITTSGVAHRSLAENGHNDVLLKYMEDALQKHHISPDALQRHMDLITSLKIKGLPILRSPYPQDFTTQKGNFAEVFLAEYLSSTTDAQLPIYRLRYNTNPDQSMKGDDVLLFDLDADPVRIIVGESKFRTTPDKQAVVDIVDGLVRSNKAGLPISLMFVAERLFQEGKSEIGQRVQNCALLFATNKLQITVSMAILDDIDKFKSLALSFILSTDAEDQIEQTNNIVREIEIWSNANAANLMEFVPSQTILDNFRHCWISGMPLSEIIKSEPNAAKISKDYYGYTLPWIIHAISQMFDSESEQIFIQAYSSIAMFVELGLPNVTSSNIYLAGVRSRGAALELSNFDVFQNKSISEVKRILSSFQLQDCEISETTKAWIKLLSDSANSQKPKEVSFPAFTWKRNGLPDKLYLRETNGDCFLISEDGYFYEKVESTSELPFLEIANIQGLYFKRDDDIWNLRSNNPKITVR